MDSSQDELGIDNENNRTIFLRENDPFLPMIPLPEIEEEPLEGGLNAPPTTPLHSPYAFLKEDRWLFSPPPVLTAASTRLDNLRTEFSATHHDTEKWNNSPVFRKEATRPASLVLPPEEHPPRKMIKPTTVATHLDHNSQGTLELSTTIEIEHFGVPPFLLVRPVTLPIGTEPTIWKPPPLLQIVSRPTPNLVKRLTTSRVSYVSSPHCQTFRK